ncbi:hypothetical protein C1I94_09315 [Akkermansia muciniphila]|nr:hypothetical protein C1I94_09315 [Akkermansia muciniphila]
MGKWLYWDSPPLPRPDKREPPCGPKLHRREPQEKNGGSYGSEQTCTARQNFEEMTNTAHVCRQTKRLSFLPRAENESACFLVITHSNGKIQTCPGKNARGTEQAVMPA